jgi:hypothetical protein
MPVPPSHGGGSLRLSANTEPPPSGTSEAAVSFRPRDPQRSTRATEPSSWQLPSPPRGLWKFEVAAGRMVARGQRPDAARSWLYIQVPNSTPKLRGRGVTLSGWSDGHAHARGLATQPRPGFQSAASAWRRGPQPQPRASRLRTFSALQAPPRSDLFGARGALSRADRGSDYARGE